MDILLIEDDATDVKLLSAVLHSSGHRVIHRWSAEQTIERPCDCQPDVSLLDLKLPGMNGLQLARHLRDDPKMNHVPIVVITAARETFGREDALRVGCDAYIVKPVDTRSITTRLETIASHRPD